MLSFSINDSIAIVIEFILNTSPIGKSSSNSLISLHLIILP